MILSKKVTIKDKELYSDGENCTGWIEIFNIFFRLVPGFAFLREN